MLKVIEKAQTQDLTILETVKTELQIAGTADDEAIYTFIRHASAEISRFCDRVFGAETVIETFDRHPYRSSQTSTLRLSRYPVKQIISLEEYGNPLIDTDYEIDLETGEISRFAPFGTSYAFDGYGYGWGPTRVTYRGGYDLLPELPYDLERSCIEMVKRYFYGRSRDPLLRSERILDVIDSSWSAVTSVESRGGLPADIAQKLFPYRRLSA